MPKLDELEKIFNEYGLSDTDLEKLKERKYDEVNEETKKVLTNVGIGEKEIEEMLSIQEENEMDHQCHIIKSKEEFTQCGQETPEEKIIPRDEIKKFLQDRSMSRSFINTFLKIGFNEEFQRLLCGMGFDNEEISELKKLWELEMEKFDTDSLDSLASSSAEKYLSSDSLYLKYLISKPLTQALREIVMKKPFDPVEYLGYWLLNYKICEEKEKRDKEFKLDLMIERERIRLREEAILREKKEDEIEGEEEEDEEEEEEEEEFFEDWILINE